MYHKVSYFSSYALIRSCLFGQLHFVTCYLIFVAACNESQAADAGSGVG